MELILIPARHVDYAWRDGAYTLGESCEKECTIDQLKMLIAREERQLVRLDNDGKTVGWGVFVIENRPNIRALFVTNLVAHNAHFERFYTQIENIAKDLGCSVIRFAAKPAQQRLYRIKLNAEPVYTVMEKAL